MRISDWSSDVCSSDLRLKLHRLRFRHRIDEARMRGEVGGIEIDHAHRAARGRVVDRPQIEVAKLVRRKQGETPAPGGAARQIVGKVVMRRDPGARADPDALQGIAVAQLHPVRFVEPVEMRRNIDRRQRSEEHTSELQSLMRISYAVFCFKKKKTLKKK